jgi:hypothetical protein
MARQASSRRALKAALGVKRQRRRIEKLENWHGAKPKRRKRRRRRKMAEAGESQPA